MSFQTEVSEWAKKTFPNSSDHGRLFHLHEEVIELMEKPHDGREMADIYLILLHHAEAHGIDLAKVAKEKFEIVKNRKWGHPDKNGIIHHLK